MSTESVAVFQAAEELQIATDTDPTAAIAQARADLTAAQASPGDASLRRTAAASGRLAAIAIYGKYKTVAGALSDMDDALPTTASNPPTDPVDIDLSSNIVYTNTALGAGVHVQFHSTDVDGNPVTYPALDTNPGGYFGINPTTGIPFIVSHPPAGDYIIGARSYDGTFYSANQGFATITVLEAPPAPPNAAVSRWAIPDATKTYQQVSVKQSEVNAGTWLLGYTNLLMGTFPAFDPTTAEFYFFGGGSPYGYGGNEVVRLNGKSGAWTRLTNPSNVTGSGPSYGRPASGPPNCTSYGSFVFHGPTGTCFLFVTDSVFTGQTFGPGNGEVWQFNPSQTTVRDGMAPVTWRLKTAVLPVSMRADLDPFYKLSTCVLVNGDIRIQSFGHVCYYTPATDTMGAASSHSAQSPIMALDTVNNLIHGCLNTPLTLPATSGSTTAATQFYPEPTRTTFTSLYGMDASPSVAVANGVPYFWGGGSTVVKREAGKYYRNVGSFPTLGSNRNTIEGVGARRVAWGYSAADNRFYGLGFMCRTSDGQPQYYAVMWRPPTAGWVECSSTDCEAEIQAVALNGTHTLTPKVYHRGFALNKQLASLDLHGSTFGGYALGSGVSLKAFVYAIGNVINTSNPMVVDGLNLPGDQNYRFTSGGGDANSSIDGFRMDGVVGTQANITLSNFYICGCNNGATTGNNARNPANVSGVIGYQNVSGVGFRYFTDGVSREAGTVVNTVSPGNSHGFYIGCNDTVVFTRVTSMDVWFGHLFKSRCRRTELDRCWGIGRHNHSFCVDIPEGGESNIHDSYFLSGKDSDQSYLIAYGKEIENNGQVFFSQVPWPINTLTVTDNLFISEIPGTTVFCDLRTIDSSIPPGWAPSFSFTGNVIIAPAFSWGDPVTQGWASQATLDAANPLRFTGANRYANAINAGVVIPPNLLRTLAAIMDVTTTDLLNPSTGEVITAGVTRTYATFKLALDAGKVVPADYYERSDGAPAARRINLSGVGPAGLLDTLHVRQDTVIGSDLVTTVEYPRFVFYGSGTGVQRNGSGWIEVRNSNSAANEGLIDVGSYQKRITFKNERASVITNGSFTIVVAAADHNNMIMFVDGTLVIKMNGASTIRSNNNAMPRSVGQYTVVELVDDGTKSVLRTKSAGGDKGWDYELPSDIRTHFMVTNKSYLFGLGVNGVTASSGATAAISDLEVTALPTPEGVIAQAANAATPLTGFRAVTAALSSQYAGLGVYKRTGFSHQMVGPTFLRGTFVVTDLPTGKVTITTIPSTSWLGNNGAYRFHVDVSPSTSNIVGGLSIHGFLNDDFGYFLRNNGDGTHSFYTSQSAAQTGGATGRVVLTSLGSGTQRIWSHKFREPNRDVNSYFGYMISAYEGGMYNTIRETVVHYNSGHVTALDSAYEMDPHNWTYKKTVEDRDHIQPISDTSNGGGTNPGTIIQSFAPQPSDMTMAANPDGVTGDVAAGATQFYVTCPSGQTYTARAKNGFKTHVDQRFPLRLGADVKSGTQVTNADGPQLWVLETGSPGLRIAHPAGSHIYCYASSGRALKSEMWPWVTGTGTEDDDRPCPAQSGYCGNTFNPVGNKFFCNPGDAPYDQGSSNGNPQGIIQKTANANDSIHFSLDGATSSVWTRETNGNLTIRSGDSSVAATDTDRNLGWYIDDQNALFRLNFNNPNSSLQDHAPWTVSGPLWGLEGPALWIKKHNYLFVPTRVQAAGGYKIIDLNPALTNQAPITIVTMSTPNFRGYPPDPLVGYGAWSWGQDIDNVNDVIILVEAGGAAWKIDVSNPDPTHVSWTPQQMNVAQDRPPRGHWGGSGSGDNGKWRIIQSTGGAMVGPIYAGTEPISYDWWVFVPENYVAPA